MIVPKGDCIPDEVSCGLDTVGIRLPSHPMARALIHEAAYRWQHRPRILQADRPRPRRRTLCTIWTARSRPYWTAARGVGVESTVITLALERPRLLRPGGITLEQLRSVLGEVDVDRALYEKIGDDVKVSAPGMKYRHYAPKAPVTVVRGNPQDTAKVHCSAYRGLHRRAVL